jgi:hypothetical protein
MNWGAVNQGLCLLTSLPNNNQSYFIFQKYFRIEIPAITSIYAQKIKCICTYCISEGYKMPNEKMFLIKINPTKDDPFLTLRTIRQKVNENPSITQIALMIKSGSNKNDFWVQLFEEFKQATEDLNFPHIIIKGVLGEELDIANLLALPLFETAETISIEGKLSKSSLKALFERLATNHKLTSFNLMRCPINDSIDTFLDCLVRSPKLKLTQLSLSDCGLNTSSATKLFEILRNIPNDLKSLDLSYNPINTKNGEAEFKAFCNAVAETPLKSLTLSSIGDNETQTFTNAMLTISESFELNLKVMPTLTLMGHSDLKELESSNPYIKITYDDPLNCLIPTPDRDLDDSPSPHRPFKSALNLLIAKNIAPQPASPELSKEKTGKTLKL